MVLNTYIYQETKITIVTDNCTHMIYQLTKHLSNVVSETQQSLNLNLLILVLLLMITLLGRDRLSFVFIEFIFIRKVVWNVILLGVFRYYR